MSWKRPLYHLSQKYGDETGQVLCQKSLSTTPETSELFFREVTDFGRRRFFCEKKTLSPNCKKNFLPGNRLSSFRLERLVRSNVQPKKKKLVKNFFWRQNEIFFVDQFVCFQFSSQARNVFQHQRQTNFVGNESTSESETKAEIRPILKKSGECQLPHDFTFETKFLVFFYPCNHRPRFQV